MIMSTEILEFSEPLPPTVHEILENRDQVKQRYPLFQSKRYRISRVSSEFSSSKTPKSSWTTFLKPFGIGLSAGKSLPPKDTPSASLYRMYEFLVADWTLQLRNELEYFCREQPSWSIFDIPDPRDTNPLRYAVLAVLTKLMCIAFNRRVDLGLPRDAPAIVEDFEELSRRPKVYEKQPEWALCVQSVEEMVFIPDERGNVLGLNDRDVSVEFRKMNIIIKEPHVHFV